MYESEIIEPIDSEFQPTNLSRIEGQFQDDFQDYDTKPFHFTSSQELKKGYTILNPKAAKNKYSTGDFDKIKFMGRDAYITNNNDGSVQSAMHDGQYTILDLPYRDSGLDIGELGKIYSDDYNGYRTTYRNYDEI
jgi:hypothetical protein